MFRGVNRSVVALLALIVITTVFVSCSKAIVQDTSSSTSVATTENGVTITSDLEQIQESKAVSNSTTKRNSDSSKVPDNDINYDGTTTTKKSGTPTTHSSKKHTTTEKTTTSNGTTKKEPATDKDGWVTKWY